MRGRIYLDAAVRELREETGIIPDRTQIGPATWRALLASEASLLPVLVPLVHWRPGRRSSPRQGREP